MTQKGDNQKSNKKIQTEGRMTTLIRCEIIYPARKISIIFKNKCVKFEENKEWGGRKLGRKEKLQLKIITVTKTLYFCGMQKECRKWECNEQPSYILKDRMKV